MQDLGKITVDVVTGEGGGGSGAPADAEKKLGLGEMLKGLPGLFSAVKGNGLNLAKSMDLLDGILENSGSKFGSFLTKATFALGLTAFAASAAVKAFKAIYDSVMKLHQFIMSAADDLREFSPAIQLADMTNEIAMTMQKFRLGMVVGPAIANQVAQAGRIERSLAQIRSFAAGVGAAFLAPLTENVAKILEALTVYLPKMIESLSGGVKATAEAFQKSGSFLLSSQISPMFGASMMVIGTTLLTKVVPALNQIARNTQQPIDFTAQNQPFLNDLRLMGAKI
jgi:hypothetical protein